MSSRRRLWNRPAARPPAAIDRALADAAVALSSRSHWLAVCDLLGPRLHSLDPAAAASDPVLVDAVILYADAAVHVPGHDPEVALAWARYAHHAAADLYPQHHERRTAATDALAALANLHRRHDEAIPLARAELDRRIHSGDAVGEVGDRLRLAAYLLQAGECDDARVELVTAWDTWTRHHPPLPAHSRLRGPLGIDTMQVGTEIVAMLNSCHRHTEAKTVLKQMQDAVIHAFVDGDPYLDDVLELADQYAQSTAAHRDAYHRDQPCACRRPPASHGRSADHDEASRPRGGPRARPGDTKAPDGDER